MQGIGESPGGGTVWALVPVKSLERAKRRLNGALGPDRREFSCAMIRDLMGALEDSGAVHRICVVTADRHIQRFAESRHAMVVSEARPCDMNRAIAQGVRAVSSQGGRHLAILPADLPLATGAEIDRLIGQADAARHTAERPVVGICPSQDLGGTNLLYLDADLEFTFQYGPNSFERHRKAVRDCNAEAVILDSPRISLDIDNQEDLDKFIELCRLDEACRATDTWRFLSSGDHLQHSAAAC